MYQITQKDIFGISQTSLYQPKLMARAEDAASLLGELRSISSGIVNEEYIITALKNIESLGSAKIEGTTGNLGDLYQEENIALEEKKKLKLFSAVGYRLGLNELQRILQDYKKIDLAVLRHLHKIITENDPATAGTPGELRKTPVMIVNSKLGNISPANYNQVPILIETYLNKKIDKTQKSLVQIAIGHYQFEAIHPFADGNGRTGRLLIAAYLLYYGRLIEPILNLSDYFEKNRDEYLVNLRSVSEKKDFYDWVKFFLKGVASQAQNTLRLISELRQIRENALALIKQRSKSTTILIETLDFSLNKLYFTIADFSKFLAKSNFNLKDYEQTARLNVRRLEAMKILQKSHRLRNADVYCNVKLQTLLMQGYH